ncbi:MAG: hypothetical protein IJ797_00145, partial [Selenomonadaceae bacterium]|nr:hypothetical protein [Selenomonadaceae bacterium]
MATQVEVIKKFVKGLIDAGNNNLTGTSAVDYAIKSLGINGISNYALLKVNFIKSAQKYDSTQKFLETECGVRLNNADIGAISGSDAGGTTTKTAESIIAENSEAKSLTDNQYKTFTKNGLTVNVTYDNGSGGSAFYKDKDYYLYKQKEIVRHLYNWWVPEALDLIKESTGISLNNGAAINVKFEQSSNYSTGGFGIYYKLFNWKISNDLGLASTINLTINSSMISDEYLNELSDNDKNGTLDKGNLYLGTYVNNYESNISGSTKSYYMDHMFAKDLAEIVLRSTIAYYYELPTPIKSGLKNIIVGGDDISKYYSDYTTSNDNGNSPYGYTLLRWLAKNYASEVSGSTGGNSTDNQSDNDDSGNNNNTGDNGGNNSGGNSNDDSGDDSGSDDNNNTVKGGNNDDDGDGLIFNKGKTAVTITADYENDAFDANDYDDLVNINASKATYDLEIIGNENKNSIVGGKGDDILNGGDGDDTLTGGKGEDTFVYKRYDGNDVITDYKPGEDKIEISEGEITDIK